jgi:hypothetical protein
MYYHKANIIELIKDGGYITGQGSVYTMDQSLLVPWTDMHLSPRVLMGSEDDFIRIDRITARDTFAIIDGRPIIMYKPYALFHMAYKQLEELIDP